MPSPNLSAASTASQRVKASIPIWPWTNPPPENRPGGTHGGYIQDNTLFLGSHRPAEYHGRQYGAIEIEIQYLFEVFKGMMIKEVFLRTDGSSRTLPPHR
jgi:hypothetical protein